MRKILVLLTMAGLIVSALPTVLLAQQATPVIDDPEPTPTEVIEEPEPTPTEVIVEPEPTPTEVVVEEPNAKPANTGGDFAAMDEAAPSLTLNGYHHSIVVPVGHPVQLQTDTEAMIYSWLGTDTCQGDSAPFGNYILLGSDEESISSYRASWSGANDAPLSACLSITWSDETPPTVGPPLTINGESQSISLMVGQPATIETEIGASFYTYTDAGCTLNPFFWGHLPQTLNPDEPKVISVRAFWDGQDTAPGSDCLTITWMDESPTTAPSLTINDESESVELLLGVNATLKTETGAGFRAYGEATCAEVGAEHEWHEMELAYDVPKLLYVRAYWIVYPTAPMSDCLSITWTAEAPTTAPSLTINGESGNVELGPGETATLKTESGANLIVFSNATCTGTGAWLNHEEADYTQDELDTLSVQSFWPDYPTAPSSDCLTFTWVDEAPTTGPEIAINGQSGNIELELGGVATVTTEPGTRVRTYTDATCAESEAAFEFNPEDAIFTYDGPALLSVKSYWIDYPEAPMSECLTVTWVDPQYLVPPVLLVDGSPESKRTLVGNFLPFNRPTNAQMFEYEGTTCDGDFREVPGIEDGVRKTSAGTFSYQVQWRDYPDVGTSDCLWVEWYEPGTDEAPTLKINNSETSRIVPTGWRMDITTDSGATIFRFDNRECEAPGENMNTSSLSSTQGTPTILSYQAAWTDDTDGPRSACLSIVWTTAENLQAPTLLVDGVVENKYVDVNSPLEFTTEKEALIYVYESETCGYGQSAVGHTSPYEHKSDTAVILSFQAEWNGFPDAPVSNCITVTWGRDQLAPRAYLNGQENDVTVASGEPIAFSSSSGSVVAIYSTADCTGEHGEDAYGAEPRAYVGPTVMSIRAFYRNNPDNTSACLVARWNAPIPTLTLNGGGENASVESGEIVTFVTEDFALLRVFPTLDCSGPASSEVESGFAPSFQGPTSISVRAVHMEDDSATSPCTVVTWNAPAPTLTLNGLADNATVESGETVTFVTEDFAVLRLFLTLDCSGNPTSEVESGIVLSLVWPNAISVQAVHMQDNSATSACFTASWNIPIPTLILNGQASDVTVDSGETVTFVTEEFGTLRVFETLDCSGPATSEEVSGYAQSLVGPAAISVQAVHEADDTATSECFTASWNAPDEEPAPSPTPTEPVETPVPSPTPTMPVETPTPSPTPTLPVETPTPEPTETPVTKSTSIMVEMWDGSSIEGAEWTLYAPVASQTISDVYATGVLDLNNSAVLTDIPAGNYAFEVTPAGMDAQRFDIAIGAESEEIVLQFAQPVTPATPVATPPATLVPDEPTPTQATGAVSGLPDTGSGSGGSSAVVMLAGLLTASILVAVIGRRRSTTR